VTFAGAQIHQMVVTMPLKSRVPGSVQEPGYAQNWFVGNILRFIFPATIDFASA
jgi:hypothetical protein